MPATHASSILPKLPAEPDCLSPASSPLVNCCLLEVRDDPLSMTRGLFSKPCTMRGLEKRLTRSATPELEKVSSGRAKLLGGVKLSLTVVRRGSRKFLITSLVSWYPPTPAL